MTTIQTLTGFITRDSGGSIYFHLQQPYSKTISVVDSRKPDKIRVDKQWFSQDKSFYLDFDEDCKNFPDLQVDYPIADCKLSIQLPS